MAILSTIIMATLGIFIILTGWVTVDLLARKQLGERQHGCQSAKNLEGHHHRHGGSECVGCQALHNCQQDDEDED